MIVPDTIEPVVGWKGLNLDAATLTSIYAHWDPHWPLKKKYEANCTFEHVAPGVHCGCGIYLAERYERAMHYTSDGGALVEIYGWGKIVEHEVGWRVQYAYPKRIILLNGRCDELSFDAHGRPYMKSVTRTFSQAFADALANRYGVPVMIANREDYPSMFTARFAFIRAMRIFVCVYGGMQLVFLLFKKGNPELQLSIAIINAVLLMILLAIPTRKKPPHERKQP